ncbi:hypothetical protein AKJ16_DCAP19256 [Drosera capensis]
MYATAIFSSSDGIKDLPRQPLFLLASCYANISTSTTHMFLFGDLSREHEMYAVIFLLLTMKRLFLTNIYHNRAVCYAKPDSLLRNATIVSAVIEDCFIPKIEFSSVGCVSESVRFVVPINVLSMLESSLMPKLD